MSISFNSGQSSILCIGAFLLVFGILITIALVSAGKRKRAIQAGALQAGFVAVPKPDPRFVEELRPVYAPARVVKVRNVMKKTYADESLTLFDASIGHAQQAENSGTNEESEVANLAVNSPYLDLPHFYILSRIQVPGVFGSIIDSLLERAILSLGLKYVQEVPPEFDAGFKLYVGEGGRGAEVFTESVLTQISHMTGLYIRGCGKVLVLNRKDLIQEGKLDAALFAEYVQQARQLTDLFAR